MEPHHVQAQVCQVEMRHCCRGFSVLKPTKTSGAEPASQQEKSLLCYSPESWGGQRDDEPVWGRHGADQDNGHRVQVTKKSWCLIISVTASIQARLQTSDKNDLRFFLWDDSSQVQGRFWWLVDRDHTSSVLLCPEPMFQRTVFPGQNPFSKLYSVTCRFLTWTQDKTQVLLSLFKEQSFKSWEPCGFFLTLLKTNPNKYAYNETLNWTLHICHICLFSSSEK